MLTLLEYLSLFLGWWTNSEHENSLVLSTVTSLLHTCFLASLVQTNQKIEHYFLKRLHLLQRVGPDSYQGLSSTFFDPEMPLYCCMAILNSCSETILDFVWSCFSAAMAFIDCL